MKWFYVGLVGILVILFLFSRPLPLPSIGGDMNVSGGGIDSNKVKVSENDTNAEYLFTKLQAGSNVTIVKQNAGGDENILISATGGGGADTNCSTSPDCNGLYIQKNPLAEQNIMGFGLNIKSQNYPFVIKNLVTDTNVFRVDMNGNVQLDGNFICIDANCFIGGVTLAAGRRHFYNGYQYQARPLVGENALIIPSGACAFGVDGTDVCQDFNNSDNAIGYRISNDGNYAFKVGMAGSSLGELRYYQLTVAPTWAGTGVDKNGDVYYHNYEDLNRSIQAMMFRSNGWENQLAKLFLGTGGDRIADGNWQGDISLLGSFTSDGNIIADDNVITKGVRTNKYYNDGSFWELISSSPAMFRTSLIGFENTNLGTPGLLVGIISTGQKYSLNIPASNPWPFVLTGLGDTGLQFNTSANAIQIAVTGAYSWALGGLEAWGWMRPQSVAPTVDANKNGAIFYTNQYADGNQLLMQQRPGSAYVGVGNWQSNLAPDLNLKGGTIRGDLNLDDVNIAGNVILDGNLFAKDNNSSIGDPTLTVGGGIRFSGWEFNCLASSNGACLNIPANTFAFASSGNGLRFNGTNRVIDLVLANGTMIAGTGFTGSSNGLYFNQPQLVEPSFNILGIIPGSKWDLNDQSYIIPQVYQSKFTESRAIGQVQQGGIPNACVGMHTMAAGTVTVSTTCLRDLNSMVFLTKQNTGSVGGVYVSAKTFGTSFVISSTAGVLDDANVGWHIIQIS